jgi:hypothetical protein
MALGRWQATIVDTEGNILPGAQITVRHETVGAPLAVIYSDRDGTVSIGNPFSVGIDGLAAFHVADGAYRVTATFGAFTQDWRYVAVSLRSEGNMDNIETNLITIEQDGLHLQDTNASHDLIINAGSNLTADRTLTITTGDSDRTLTLSGNVTLTGSPIDQGKHTIWIPAAALYRGGTSPGSLSSIVVNTLEIPYLPFDATTEEWTSTVIAMPKSWNEGTLTFQFYWAHPATTTNFSVRWRVLAYAFSDDDTMTGSISFGDVGVTDVGGTTSDLYISPETSALTVGGTPAENDLVGFRIGRSAADGADTLAVDAYLIGVKIFYIVDAATDA